MPAQKKSKLKARDKVEEKTAEEGDPKKKKWQSPSSAGTSFKQCTLVGSFKNR